MIALSLVLGCRAAVMDEPFTDGAGGEGAGGAPEAAPIHPGLGTGGTAGSEARGESGAHSTMAGAAGEGGTPSSGGCESDAQCDDAEACNGSERCVDAACQEGEPISCEGATTCVEAEEPRCEYADASPWLLFMDAAGVLVDWRILAVPTAFSSTEAPVVVSDGALTEALPVSWSQKWSPDGRFLAFDASNAEELGFESRFFVVEFGPGRPLSPVAFPNLPRGTALDMSDWDPTSSAMVFTDGAEVYATIFDGTEFITTLAATESELVDRATPCRGGEYLVYASGRRVVVTPSDPNSTSTTRTLTADFYEVSPDGRWVVVSTIGEADPESNGLSLTPCGAGADQVLMELAPEFLDSRWSPDSRFVAIEFDWVPHGVWSIDAGTLQPFPTEATMIGWFSDDSSYVLVETADGASAAFFHEDAETVPFPFGLREGDWYADTLVVEEVDPETEEPVSVAIYEPLKGLSPILRVTAEDAWIEDFTVHPSSNKAVFCLTDAQSRRIRVFDLLGSSEPLEFEFPVTEGSLNLHAFSGDGRGFAATLQGVEFELWWFPLGPDTAFEPIVVHRVPLGAYASIQPWP